MKTRVYIIDNATGHPVEAEIFDEVTVEHFIETQQDWRPVVLKAARQLAARGSRQLIPQHFHWDWDNQGSRTESARQRVLWHQLRQSAARPNEAGNRRTPCTLPSAGAGGQSTRLR